MTNGLPAKMQQAHQGQEAKSIVFSIKDWLTTTNHKQVGILYIVTAIFFMAVAGSFGEMMRTQLAVPNNNFLLPFTYDQTVTLHGLLMILWVLTPSRNWVSKLYCAAANRRKRLSVSTHERLKLLDLPYSAA